ncbi:MAG: AI-2E family transporter [Deltaproteobacteria bacterium]|jgi:predicted PurR-regulated permease PerM|nr:AI-2E family transporter [Deltaproteobacteria bacterium]
MAFNIFEFAKANRVFLIWTAFAALLWILRDLFGLIFITFIMCFIAHGVSRSLSKLTRMRRRFVVIVLYLLFILALVSLFFFGLPRIFDEARNFTEQLPKTIKKIDTYINGVRDNYPTLAPAIDRAREAFTLEAILSKGWQLTLGIMGRAWHILSWFFIAIIFSFLIVMDLPHLIEKVRGLRQSKLDIIYNETASSVIQFARVVGENFRAQIYISLINTTLTFLGLTLIGTGTTALLSVVVFACGLVPVLGFIISSIPILLVSLNVGGFHMVAFSALLICFIHLLEAYVLNPRIVSRVMRLNPVMTLIILYIAHSLMGMWGMFLGVPISVYIYRQLMMPKDKEARELPRLMLGEEDAPIGGVPQGAEGQEGQEGQDPAPSIGPAEEDAGPMAPGALSLGGEPEGLGKRD